MVTKKTKMRGMLSPWSAGGPRGDRKNKKWYMLSPLAAGVPSGDRKVVDVVTMGCWRTLRCQKRPNRGACCHHGLLENLAVIEKWCMLLPLPAGVPHGYRNVVHAVTIDCWRTSW